MGEGREPRSTGRRVAGALVAILLALVLVTALLEVGLRVAEWFYLRQRGTPPSTQGARTLLCVGDSWTYGQESGNPAEASYPSQLQRLIDERVGRGKVRVVNRGLPGAYSSHLVGKMERLLDELSPHVVLVQVGALNWLRKEWAGASPLSGQRLSIGGPGVLDRLRVVRFMRMLLTSGEEDLSQASRRELDRLRQQALAVLRSKEARDDTRGTPPLATGGCSEPSALQQALGAGRERGRQLEQLLGQQPECGAAHLALAELCLEAKDGPCAVRSAERAMTLHPDDPRAKVALAAALRLREGRWPDRALELLERTRGLAPEYTRLFHLLLLAEAELDFNLCSFKNLLAHLQNAHPGCSWCRKLLRATKETLAGRVLWDQREREIRTDLDAIVSLCRRRGARVVLLNYGEDRSNPCRSTTVALIRAIARERGLPLVDLGVALPPFVAEGGQRVYAPGGHPNRVGYATIAKAVLDKLIEIGEVKAE